MRLTPTASQITHSRGVWPGRGQGSALSPRTSWLGCQGMSLLDRTSSSEATPPHTHKYPVAFFFLPKQGPSSPIVSHQLSLARSGRLSPQCPLITAPDGTAPPALGLVTDTVCHAKCHLYLLLKKRVRPVVHWHLNSSSGLPWSLWAAPCPQEFLGHLGGSHVTRERGSGPSV